eukprot:CAMPEP_0196817352 /NCGR_PEP_ID=MMETSP1362-20130617/60167_1 /TAXON_ID=163516 /ORGANISM="Leptocylindrus danicus, Strain CCMP1856" /LENGTH=138 /DNA_ID=CAMNT_0042195017 /DNA_START=130 /DNA_END=547 /DNA_ORIENTATION=+
MVYNSLHCLLIERRFDEAKIDVLNDLNKKMVKEPHINGDMPLHIALLLDAPDELVISIYNAYPQAANLNSHDGQTVMEIVKKRRRSAQVKNVLSGKGVTVAASISMISDHHQLQSEGHPEKVEIQVLRTYQMQVKDRQ